MRFANSESGTSSRSIFRSCLRDPEPSSSLPRTSSSGMPSIPWYSSLLMSSMRVRRASPLGRSINSVNRSPYFAVITFQPFASNIWRNLWIRIPGITRSRLWRLRSMIQMHRSSSSTRGSSADSQTQPSSSSPSPMCAKKRPEVGERSCEARYSRVSAPKATAAGPIPTAPVE